MAPKRRPSSVKEAPAASDAASSDAEQPEEQPEQEDAAPPPPPPPQAIVPLDRATIDRIAAGEVVARPGNALKEMFENAIDAGARTIAVSVAEGGVKLLRVSDDGSGVRKSDLKLLCVRHATSKLRTFEDLQSIQSFGFRGEALASISHVAKLSILTKTREAPCAYRCAYRDGEPVDGPTPCAGADGTTITVEDLFYNMPTRRRAMASSAADQYHFVSRVCGAYAVHYAGRGVSVSCRKAQGACDVNVAGGDTLAAIRAVHGAVADDVREFSCARKPGDDPDVCTQDDGGEHACEFACRGFVSRRAREHSTLGATPTARDAAKRFTLFVNDRLVESAAFKRMVDEAYAASADAADGLGSRGKAKPFAYLAIDVPGRHVDVNVHPTKKEVAFLYEAPILDTIRCHLEKLVAETAHEMRIADLSDAKLTASPKRRKTSGGSRSSLSQASLSQDAAPRPSQPRAEPSLSQRPEKMIRTDPRDQRMDAFFSPSQRKRAPPPAAVVGNMEPLWPRPSQDDDDDDYAPPPPPPPDTESSPADDDDDDDGAAPSPASPVARRTRRADRPSPARPFRHSPSKSWSPQGDGAPPPSTQETAPPSSANDDDDDAPAGDDDDDDDAAAPPADDDDDDDAEAAPKRPRRRAAPAPDEAPELTVSQEGGTASFRAAPVARDGGGAGVGFCSKCGARKDENLATVPGAFSFAYEQLAKGTQMCEECGAVVSADGGLLKKQYELAVRETACKYDSVRELLDAIRARRPGVQSAEAMRQHVLVGHYDAHWTIIQHGTHLALANTGALSVELFYQLAIRQFGESPTIEFDPPGDLVFLMSAYLRNEEPDRTEASAAADAAKAAATLGSKAAMLEEYFSVKIDAEKGLLLGMPELLREYVPEPSAIPRFLWVLANETEWRYEKACFENVARALGTCYATLPSDDADEKVLNERAEAVLKTSILPALKTLLLPPEDLADADAVIKLTSLERMYRVFERC